MIMFHLFHEIKFMLILRRLGTYNENAARQAADFPSRGQLPTCAILSALETLQITLKL